MSVLTQEPTPPTAPPTAPPPSGNVVGDVQPSKEGLPMANLIETALDWGMQLALWGCLAALLGGGALWGLGQLANNQSGAGKGKTMVIGGAVGAVIAGIAPMLVHELFTFAQTGT